METKIKINSMTRLAQVILFNGLVYGTAYPTDIDLMIEYNDIGYIFGELKYDGAPVKMGQRLALERLSSDCYKMTSKGLIKKPCISIIADHCVSDPKSAIIAKDCVTRCVFFNDGNHWSTAKQGVPLEQTIREFLDYCDKYKDLVRTNKVKIYS